jgi:hypothetical protein
MMEIRRYTGTDRRSNLGSRLMYEYVDLYNLLGEHEDDEEARVHSLSLSEIMWDLGDCGQGAGANPY